METYFEPTPQAIQAGLVNESAIALGFFDGVHLGHQAVIGSAKAEAQRLGVACGVVTFKDHPRALTRGRAPLLLTVIEQRLELFADLGVDFALVLSFTEELCKLSPREYVENILVGGLGARSISVGPNHHFGRDAEGDASLLREIGLKNDYVVHVAEMVKRDTTEVSSSAIRDFILKNQMEEAAGLLSRPYAILGEVVEGDKRGRLLGFPTANLALYPYQLVPGRGVYVGKAKLPDKRCLPCVINVGYRPTFKDRARQIENAESNCCQANPDKAGEKDGEPVETGLLTVEAHLLDFNEDIYNQFIEVNFLSFLRGEQKFAGADALKEQIKKDIERARNHLSTAQTPGIKPGSEPPAEITGVSR